MSTPQKSQQEIRAKQLSDEAIAQLRDLFNRVPNDRRKEIFEEPNKRPTNWSRKSNAPYYKERYALQLRSVLDEMIQEHYKNIHTTRYFYYKEANLSKNSMYLMIRQSLMFLLDQMDPDRVYKRFSELIKIEKEETGIRISYCDDIEQLADSPLNKVVVIEDQTEQEITVQARIEEFLENAKPGEKFELTRLQLDNEIVENLRLSVSQLKDIVASITRTNIRLIKLSPEDAAKLESL